MSSRKHALRTVTTWLVVGLAMHSSIGQDCSKQQDLNAIRNCCNMPSLRLEAFKPTCGRHMRNGFRFSPCLFECIFNATNLMRGTTLNIDNVRSLGVQLMGNRSEFIDVYVAGLQKCIGIVDDMNRFKGRKLALPLSGESCPPTAMLLGMCAHKHAYSECPVSSWSDTEQCQQAQEYVRNCKLGKGAPPLWG